MYTVCVIRYKIIVDHFRPGKCTGHCVAIGPSEKGLYFMPTSEADLHKVACMEEAKLAIPLAIP